MTDEGNPQMSTPSPFRNKIMQVGVYSKTKKRPDEKSARDMVKEEIQKQRDILKGTGKGTSWWDEKNNCVSVTVKGASYFNEGQSRSGNPLRIYADNWFGDKKAVWTKKTVSKFIDQFEMSLNNDEFIDDTAHWLKRYESKISGSKGRKKK